MMCASNTFEPANKPLRRQAIGVPHTKCSCQPQAITSLSPMQFASRQYCFKSSLTGQTANVDPSPQESACGSKQTIKAIMREMEMQLINLGKFL